ncbi:SpoIVB peptidase [Jeotgalibacillus sp. S-D1]|uniref:SpoIVB peptidase n=1 Tax=Jeotgalibacillus sp. S-D1 TaxID=2552189 RepID=UPI00105A0D0E|nr:SpoIVB peptidase [Jeotgalibacillus sp. S-D1]TDL34636.1 SpoIVB peptidase [Jeotgalibacillus sp. S-D1]
MSWKKLVVVLSIYMFLLFPSLDETIHASAVKLIPGGQSIGISMESNGVMIVGFHSVNEQKLEDTPASKAGLKVGDTLSKINGVTVSSAADLSQVLSQQSKNKASIKIEIEREGKIKQISVKPSYNEQGHPQLGLYVRHHTQGIGTVSYIDPQTGAFGALGHVVADADTQKAVDMRKGSVLQTQIDGIQKGISGKPGGKIAIFSTNDAILGTVSRNSEYGIFGKLQEVPEHSMYKKPLTVAKQDEITEGKAEMLTVLHDNTIERFQIEIVRAKTKAPGGTTGMLIRITDPDLLEQTGGIIQGMSGSPIIQKGKLVGAVTHVLVHDPTSGYALSIEEMLKQSGQSFKGKQAS